MDYALSTDCKTADALFAQEQGYEVHHDMTGWYVVKPHEWRDGNGCDRHGRSLGWNGRRHFADCEDAWTRAAEMARAPKKEKAVA